MKDKTKKRVFFNTYIMSLIISLFFLVASYGAVAFLIYEWFEGTGKGIKILFFVFPVFVIFALLMTFVFLFGILKFVVIDEKRVVWKNADGKAIEIKWQELKEVRIKTLSSKPYEFVFVNKVVDVAESQKTKEDRSKTDYIYLKYNNEREQFLKQLKPDLSFIIEENEEQI